MRITSPLAGEGWGEGLYESQAPSPQSSPVEGEEVKAEEVTCDKASVG